MADTTSLGNAVLQIVHVSDLHFHDPASTQDDSIVRRAISWVHAFSAAKGRWLMDYWEDGRAGHAPDAQVAFESFLSGNPMLGGPPGTPERPPAEAILQTKAIPTWLVDTGDMASFGDPASVQAEMKWVDRIAVRLNAVHIARLYGNHDAWPMQFPLVAKKPVLHAHRDALRATGPFAASWPLHPLSQPIAGTAHRIDLYAVNSVVHDKWTNTFAEGSIESDPHWKGSTAVDQLPALNKAVVQRALLSGFAFRILLSHHPVHYPPPDPGWNMTLKNAKAVARGLQAASTSGVGPLAHLVLSGHTHQLFPGHGALPGNAGAAHHDPLGLHQLQMVVGSLSKATRAPSGSPSGTPYDVAREPHQCQVLRFFTLPGHPRTLVMQRALIGRNNGTGRFAFVPHKSGDLWEASYLDF